MPTPYASLADITISAGGEERLKQLADQNGDGSVDTPVIERAQRDADAHINQFTNMRFASLIGTDLLPIATAIELAADEVVFRLKKYIGQLTQEDRDDYAERVLRLQALATGETRPSEPPPAKSSAITSAWVDRTDDDTPTRSRGPF